MDAVFAFALAGLGVFMVGFTVGKRRRKPRPVAEVWQDLSAAERKVFDLLLQEHDADAKRQAAWRVAYDIENERKEAMNHVVRLRRELDASRRHYATPSAGASR